MSRNSKIIFVIVVSFLSFAANPHGPLGFFWRPDSLTPDPTTVQLPFFMLLNIFESVTFAAACALLFFHMPKKPFQNLTLTQTRLAFVCILWFLGNWWVHDSLHIHNGMDLNGLLFIEYGFHVTMMAGAAYLIWIAKKLYYSK